MGSRNSNKRLTTLLQTDLLILWTAVDIVDYLLTRSPVSVLKNWLHFSRQMHLMDCWIAVGAVDCHLIQFS